MWLRLENHKPNIIITVTTLRGAEPDGARWDGEIAPSGIATMRVGRSVVLWMSLLMIV